MKIVQYISELIQMNGSITIPDFGAFILTDTSTIIDNKNKLLLPSSKILIFNENVKDNDNILIDYLIKVEGISKIAAEEALFKFVFQLKNLLTSGKTIDFRNIGKLRQDNKKQIVFEMDNKVEYASDSFGLTTIKAKTFSSDIRSSKKSNNEINEKSEKQANKMPKVAFLIIVIAIPLLALATLAFLFPDKTKEIYANTKNSILSMFKKSNSENTNKNIAIINDTLKTSNKPVVKDTANNHEVNDSSSNTKIKENISTINEVKPHTYDNKQFHIIVGCFQSKKNAENYFKTIQNKGYFPQIIDSGNDGLFKVSCASFSTREEAKRELNKVINDIGTQAWILKK